MVDIRKKMTYSPPALSSLVFLRLFSSLLSAGQKVCVVVSVALFLIHPTFCSPMTCVRRLRLF